MAIFNAVPSLKSGSDDFALTLERGLHFAFALGAVNRLVGQLRVQRGFFCVQRHVLSVVLSAAHNTLLVSWRGGLQPRV